MDGVRHCPNCGRANVHLLRRDENGLFAWCQECFRVFAVDEPDSAGESASEQQSRPDSDKDG